MTLFVLEMQWPLGISELTRLSRLTKDLFELVERISSAVANNKSLEEARLDTTTTQWNLNDGDMVAPGVIGVEF